MGDWKIVDERTKASEALLGAVTCGLAGGGKTHTVENSETGETKEITESNVHTPMDSADIGRAISDGRFDK